MSLKSIEQEWDGFAEMVFANTRPSATQVAEMKKAFFGGAWAMFNAVAEIGEPHITDEEGCQYLDERKAECEAFKKQLMSEYSERN